MTDFSWVCRGCGRRIPRKVTMCRCGAEYDGAADASHPQLAAAPGAASSKVSGTVTKIVAAAAAIGAMAGLSYWMTREQPPVPQRANVSATRPAVSPAPAALLDEAPRTSSDPIPTDQGSGTDQGPRADRGSATDLAPRAKDQGPVQLEDLVSRLMPAVVTVQTSGGRGSGFFVAADTILTNVHVVGSNAGVTIRRADGSTMNARVESTSAAYDIAVLKVDGPRADQTTIRMGSAADARVGQEVIAIGTPLGFLQNTVSRGIVSGLREVEGSTLVQTDAAINPGNSGGPLLDRNGTAIGIIKSGYQGRDGLSFAIAIDHARAVLDGRPAPAAAAASSTPSQYKPLAPAVTSATDERRATAEKAFDQRMAQIGQSALNLDDYWRRFRAACYEGKVSGGFDHEWFALFDRRAMQGAVSPTCGPWYSEVRRMASDIRDQVLALDEQAREAGVYPGTRRDARRRYRLDYAGWDR
jgi:S1-C subfamily serine protease